MAVDPFHDFDLPVAGMPDESNGRSLIRNIRQEVAITAPTTVVAPAKWDCHIAYFPIRCRNYSGGGAGVMTPATINTGDPTSTAYGVFSAGVAANGWNTEGFLVACKVPAGQPTFDEGYTLAEYDIIKVDDLLDWKRARLIAGGYEVHNTTEELKKSGSVTDYVTECEYSLSSMKNVHSKRFTIDDNAVSGGDTGSGTSAITGYVGPCPPSTLGEAKQINGVTRAAALGSYVQLRLARTELAPSYPIGGVVGYIGTQAPSTGICNAWLGHGLDLDATPGASGWSMSRKDAFMQSGSYYSSLSTESSLDLVLHAIVEVFPGPGDEDMATASPTAPYDPMALAILSQLQNQLPPGCAVGDNGIGDFFRRVVGIAKSITRNVRDVSGKLSTLPGQAGVVAGLVNEASELGYEASKFGERVLGKKKKRRKPARANQGRRKR
jgi:hypothetical protein